MLKPTLYFILFLSVITFAPGEAFSAKEKKTVPCNVVPLLMQAFLKAHVSNREFDRELKERTVTQFIKRTDPSKSILFESDVKAIEPKIADFLSQDGKVDCKGLESTKAPLVARAKEQLEYAKKILSNENFKLDESVEIQLDPEKRTFFKNEEEAKKRQYAQINFQISNYLLTDISLKEARKQLIHRYELTLKRLEELTPTDTYVQVINAFAAALDPHSDYYSPEDQEDFQINMQLSLEGIGASLTSDDGYTVIQELISGGSASKSKQLEPKDKIIAVGQGEAGNMENVIDMDLRDVVRKIRGKSGTKVRLTILREKPELQRFTITLVRSKVQLEDEAAKVTFESRVVNGKKLKLARLELPGFYGDPSRRVRSSYRDMANAISKINAAKVDGVLLDLSQNGGGLLEEAVKIAGLFVHTGNVVATKDSRADVQILDDVDPAVQYSGPLVILTSRLSASASEIVAGALQDYHRALIVGADHTYGKGSVQAVLPLQNDLGLLKVTTGLFFIPSGRSTQHKGISADISMPSVFSTEDFGERFLDNSLNPDSITAFLSKEGNANNEWKPIATDEIQKLAAKSKARVEKSKKFAEIIKELKESNEKKEVVKLADLRKKDLLAKKKDKGSKDKGLKQLARERHEAQREEAMNILGDLVALQQNVTTTMLAEPKSNQKKTTVKN